MIRIPAAACLLAVAGATTAQPANQDTPRRFAVGQFQSLDLASSDRVRVLPGNRISVTATGDPRAVAALAVSVRNGTLRIDRGAGSYNDRGAVVTVVMPSIRAATLSGSGGIEASGIGGAAFTGRITGSGAMALSGLRVGSLRLDLAGSGSIVTTGTAGSVAIDLGGSGRIDTRQLDTSTLTVAFGGSGSLDAVSTGSALIRSSGSGRLRIGGHPRCDVRNSGTASVRCG